MNKKINCFTNPIFLFFNLTIGLLIFSQSNLKAQLQAGNIPSNAFLDTTTFNHSVEWTNAASYSVQLNLDEDLQSEIEFKLTAYYGSLNGPTQYFELITYDPSLSIAYTSWGSDDFTHFIENGNNIDNSLNYTNHTIYIAASTNVVAGGETTTTDSFRYLPIRQLIGTNLYRYGWIRFSLADIINGYKVIGFSWTHFSSSIPLPINQLTLSANRVSPSKIKLSWTGTEEFQGESFSIERSTDAVNFSSLISYTPSNTSTNYEDQILNSNSTNLYYRIAARDIDQKIYYSNVSSVHVNKMDGIQVYPTVCTNGINIDQLEIGHHYTLTLVDFGGRTLHQTQLNATNSPFYLNMEKLKAGFYILTINDITLGHTNAFKISKMN